MPVFAILGLSSQRRMRCACWSKKQGKMAVYLGSVKWAIIAFRMRDKRHFADSPLGIASRRGYVERE